MTYIVHCIKGHKKTFRYFGHWRAYRWLEGPHSHPEYEAEQERIR